MLNELEYKFHICVKYEYSYTVTYSICNGVEVDIAYWVDEIHHVELFSFYFVDKELMTIQSETNESKSNEQSKELHVAIKVKLIN